MIAYRTTCPSTCSLINCGGYFGSIFSMGTGTGELTLGPERRRVGFVQLGEIDNPASGDACQIRQVDVECVDFFARENFLRRHAGINRAYNGWPLASGRRKILGSGLQIHRPASFAAGDSARTAGSPADIDGCR